MSSFVYKYIDTWDKAYLVCNLLRQGTYHVMAFDLEGVNLGRQGQVTLLQLAVDESCVFCFDILMLGPALLGQNFLGPLFMSPHMVKLCFDCRVDGDVLHTHFGIHIPHVYDIQVLYTMLFQANNDRFLKGLRHVLQTSGIISCPYRLHHILAAKTKIKTLMTANANLFQMRPVTTELLQYCSSDVVFLLRMYRHWHHLIPHAKIVDLSMGRLNRFLNRTSEIPSKQMSILDFNISNISSPSQQVFNIGPPHPPSIPQSSTTIITSSQQ